jgi:hypothetical protein
MAGPFVVSLHGRRASDPAEDPGGILKKMKETFESCKFCVSTHKMQRFT